MHSWASGDWIKHMAASLKIDRRTVQRWAAGEVDAGAEVFTKLRYMRPTAAEK
jgi:predicted transcriptional regulator